jgi:Ca2+-transporting ATPase
MNSVFWHHLSVEETVEKLNTSIDGLASTAAANRLARTGHNEIVRRKPIAPWRLLVKQFANFFVIVLLFAAVLAYAISFLPNEEGRRLTAFFILGIVALTILLSFFEEYRAQKELEALDRLLVFKTVVKRDGAPKQINADKVVPGDVLVLTQGQKVPADARVIEATGLRVDESALTGESVGVDKAPEPVASDAPLAERRSMVFGSTYITQGSGLAVAVRTGMQTEVGQIAATLQQMAERPTPFQVEVQKMARQMTIIVGSLAVIIAGGLLFVLHEPPIDVALNTLSLAIATIPESLPIVLTFALALGARQMAARRAVVRRLSVVESLGSVAPSAPIKRARSREPDDRAARVGRWPLIDLTYHGGRSDQRKCCGGVLCNAATSRRRALQFIGDPVGTAMLRRAIHRPDSNMSEHPIRRWARFRSTPSGR